MIMSLLLTTPAFSAAFDEQDGQAPEATEEDLTEELERQISKLDLEAWQSYFKNGELASRLGFKSADEMLLRCAEGSPTSSPQSIMDIVKELILAELSGSRAAIAGLTAAALVTGLAGILPGKSMRPALGFALSSASVLAVASAFTALCAEAAKSIHSTAEFAEKALPVMSVLLASVGASTSAGIFRPFMLFMSGSMSMLMERVVLPLILSAGIVGVIDGLGDGGRLSQLRELLLKTAKWIMGLSAVVYFAVCAMQGMTAAAADGISVRTARYTLDKLLPSTNGLVGGSVDTFMSCALLVKNGAGVASVVIMLGIIVRPLLRIAVGGFVFRISAALSRPAAAPGIVKMLESAADAASYLFGTAAVTGMMFVITVLVFTAAGGISAGLW